MKKRQNLLDNGTCVLLSLSLENLIRRLILCQESKEERVVNPAIRTPESTAFTLKYSHRHKLGI